MKALIDSNVILDIGLRRDPFFESASQLFNYPESRLQFYLTPSACTDIYYIVRKEKGHQTAVEFLGDILDTCELCYMNKMVFLEAIVTRNKRDFSSSQLSVMTPAELINSLEQNKPSH